METNQNIVSAYQLTDALIYTRKTCVICGKQKEKHQSNGSHTLSPSTPMRVENPLNTQMLQLLEKYSPTQHLLIILMKLQ